MCTRVVGCLVLALALAPGLAPPLAAASVPVAAVIAPTAEPVRYYVVGPPVNGQKEYLFGIAAKTLGNGNRYMEIFTLNQGRLQPDGKRLTDPAVIEPGWILRLPGDAAGPGVQVGLLPVDTQPPTTQAAAPPRNTPPRTTQGSDGVVRVAALAIMVALLAVSLRLLRRGKRLSLPTLSLPTLSLPTRRSTPGAPDGGDDPQPDVPPVPVPEPAAALSQASPTILMPNSRPPDRSPVLAPAALPPRRTPPPAASRAPIASGPPASSGPPGPSGPPTVPAPPLGSRPPAGPRPPSSQPPSSQPPSSASSSQPPSFKPSLSRPPAIATDGAPTGSLTAAVFQADVTSGEDLVSVRLAGVRGPRPLTPHTWVGDGARPPGGSAHVSLGRLGDSTLSVDLALAPDVITVTGPARRHLALALARQLGATGLPVTIVGNPLETEPPTGCATARTLDEVPATPASVGIVLYGPSGDDDQPAIRRLAARSAPRMVIVIVGDVPRARWSIEVRPQTTP